MKRVRFILLSALMIVALLSVGAISSLLQKRAEFKPPVSTFSSSPTKEVFGKDGIPIDHFLQIDPLQITPEHIIFSDRVLEVFTYSQADIQSGASKIIQATQNVPEGVNKYLLIAPTRIAFEGEAYREYSDDVVSAISEAYSVMPSDISTVDVVDPLLAHRSEYLYFRTDHSWTAMGAYYAAGAFCGTTGITQPDITKYREYRFTGYVGALEEITETDSLLDFPDFVAFYIADGMKNEQTITARITSDEYVTYDSPTISQARMGTDIYIGGYFSHTVIDGDVINGKVLMIVGDDYAKSFAGWMIPCYEKIILVDPRYFEGSDSEFMQMFTDYSITDFLILENVQNSGDSILNTRINQILTGSTPP